MNQRNPYMKYGYDNYEQPPEAAMPQKAGMFRGRFGQRVSMKFKNPLFATASLLLVGAAFAALIVTSYPGDSGQGEDVPVIKAETMAFKDVPADPGGMDIPFQDSTIFTSMRDGQLNESPPIENLLDMEEPVDRFAEFAAEVEKVMSEDSVENIIAEEPAAEPVEIKKIIAKVEAPAEPQRPKQLHAPASSPETLAFVRSVLDKKDAKKTAPAISAEALANIAPAAGAALGMDIQPGGYFVQLGSVTSASGAQSEWGKLQVRYETQLQGASHRVQQADLGERGTYYRIQAGPMSKDSANQTCDSIKAQKPGACLVVK